MLAPKSNPPLLRSRLNRKRLRKKLQELRSSTGAAWGEMKTGMSKAVDELHKAYDDAAKHFK